METGITPQSAKDFLEWQIEMGATESIADRPVNRYELVSIPVKKPAAQIFQPIEKSTELDAVSISEKLACAAENLDSLREALIGYEHCELKRGAKSTVFSDGNAQAKVMLIGEAPGREEDITGKPFVGRAGQLLDRMFASIGLSRGAEDALAALYITNIIPWRPPQNRDPESGEIAMMMPFIKRHVELVRPELLVLMGNTPCQAILGKKGITKLRGRWVTALGLPVMPMFHPAYLLRNPVIKRETWVDLMAVQARLKVV